MNKGLKINSVENIKKEVSLIEKKLITKQNGNNIEVFLRKIISKIKSLIKKCDSSNLMVSLSAQIELNNSYQILIHYSEIFIKANTSDKIKVFIAHCDTFTDEEYWRELGCAYILQNYKKIPYKVYYELFSSKRFNREKLMSEEEIELFKKLPNEIIIYRGGSKTELKTKKYGVSWTLDRKIAENFANVKAIRDKKEMVVIEKTISKKEAVAYFISRNEEEIIYLG